MPVKKISTKPAPPPASQPLVAPRGFLKQRQPGFMILRIKATAGHITADQLPAITEVSREFGRGELHLTTRQGIEIPWIPVERIPEVQERLEALGIPTGISGRHIRVITACPGSLVCRHGIIDAQKFARELDRVYFGADVPYKFKIAVAGCPNSCTKPRENDVGFAGMAEPVSDAGLCQGCKTCIVTCKEKAVIFRDRKIAIDPERCVACGDCITTCPHQAMTIRRSGVAVYVGGRMGRHPSLGVKVAGFADRETALRILEQALAFYRREGKARERFSTTLHRVGVAAFEQEIARNF